LTRKLSVFASFVRRFRTDPPKEDIYSESMGSSPPWLYLSTDEWTKYVPMLEMLSYMENPRKSVRDRRGEEFGKDAKE
jgi:hypothetical protein